MDKENELDPEKKDCEILELPHYVLRILLSYLDSTSLYQLSKTCSFLKEAIEDPALWKKVDARSEPNSAEKINYVSERIHEKTVHVLLRGYKKYTNIHPHTFFDRIYPFENLKVLALENIKLYASKVSLKDFPGSLEELSLKRSSVKNPDYFFQHSSKKMSNLRVLILDECGWVTCIFLLSVSKFENLEIISAVKCMRVHLHRMPYLNVAKYGCKKLKILDFRFTGIGGEILRTFYSKPSIQRMYFQSYKSAEVDYEEKFKSHAKKLNRTSVDINADLNISDNCLRDYTSTTAAGSVEPIAKSMLYQDPYPECECGYKNGDEDRTMPDPTKFSLEDDCDTYRPSDHMTAKFVCQKHLKDVEKLPSDFKDFFLIHQKQFHSDITSDTDSSGSDSSEDYDNLSCCIYAMGTKMVILPNVHEPNNRSEMNLPCRDGSRKFIPFNIFIVNPLDARNNRQQNAGSSNANNQPGPSGVSSSNNSSTAQVQKAANTDGGECSTANKVGCEKRKLEDSDSEADDESTNKKRKVEDNRESGCETVDSKESDKKDSKGRENEDSHRRSITVIYSELNPDLKNETEECGGSGTKKTTGKTISKKCDSDSDSDTEKEKTLTPKERRKWKGKRSSDSSDGPSGKKKMCKQTEGDVAQEAAHSEKLEEANDRAAEQREKVSNDQIPSTSRANEAPAEIEAPDRRFNEEMNRELADMEQWLRGSVRVHRPRQLEYWQLPNNISLRRISLRGYKKVTNMALLYLRYLQIELLDLTYTSVTKQEIENFLLYNPNCRVIHPMYCVCKPRKPF